MATVFDESLDSEDEFPSDMKGEQFVTISNGLDDDIYVKIEPMNLVVQKEKSEKHVKIGANATGINLEVSLMLKIANV